MPWCAANGCHNRTENNKEVSFHKIPKEPALRKAWYVAIGRIELPESGNICSAHFTSDCYEDNVKLQLCPELFPNRRSTKRRLKPNAIPSIFDHIKPVKSRTISIDRNQRIEHSRVCVVFTTF